MYDTVMEYASALGDGDLRSDSGRLQVGGDFGKPGEGENPLALNVGRRRSHLACKKPQLTVLGGFYPLPERGWYSTHGHPKSQPIRSQTN